VRYYVLCVSDYPDNPAYVIAEVVRDPLDGDDRPSSLAGAIAGQRAVVVTRSELLANVEGAHALEMWDGDDDESYDRENRSIRGAVDAIKRDRLLQLVPPADSGRRLA
jgi:hypothetical protein